MGMIRATLAHDAYFKRAYIQIEAESNYAWIERFVQNCSSERLLLAAVDALQKARTTKSPWVCNYNDIVAEYDPIHEIISARHELEEIDVPPPSVMPVDDFLSVLAVWKETFSATK